MLPNVLMVFPLDLPLMVLFDHQADFLRLQLLAKLVVLTHRYATPPSWRMVRVVVQTGTGICGSHVALPRRQWIQNAMYWLLRASTATPSLNFGMTSSSLLSSGFRMKGKPLSTCPLMMLRVLESA